MSSLFCQKAALAIPTLALISSSLLASSAIELPRYLKRDTCSKGTPSNAVHRCIPFGFAVPFIIIVRDYYERNSSIKICKCMEKDFGLKEYWDWLRRRKRGLHSKDWMIGLSEYGDWVLTGR